MGAQEDVVVLAEVCAVNEATLAKMIGVVMKELINLNPAAKERLKAQLIELANHPDERNRELTTQLAKQAARSAGMRLPGL